MGLTRMATVALLGAGTVAGAPLLGLGTASPASPAKDVQPAWVSPAEAAPGQSVTISVTCDTSSAKTITANSQAFSTGSATLTVGPDGKYSGTARLASKEEFSAKGPDKSGKGSSWGIDGACPNNDTFTGAVAVELGQEGHASSGAGASAGASAGTGSGSGSGSGSGAGSEKHSGSAYGPGPDTGSSGSGAGPGAAEQSPHGAVHTGLGGSVGSAGPGQLATGGALVAAGVGGFWLLRRRGADDAQE